MTVKSEHPFTQKDFDDIDNFEFGKASVDEIKTRREATNCSLAGQLIDALSKQDKNLARILLEQPLDVNEVGYRGVSALMVAAYRGYADICETLIKLGANVQYSFSCGETGEEGEEEFDGVSERASMSRDYRTMLVIEKASIIADCARLKSIVNTDPDYFVDLGSRRLVDAARLGMITVCLDLVNAGIPIDNPSSPFESAIYVAADNGNMKTAFVLLALGADFTPLQEHGRYSEEIQSSIENVKRFFTESKRIDWNEDDVPDF